MAVFKATENKKKTTTGSFQATGQRSYNTSTAYGWEKESEHAARTISRLNEKVNGGGYLSADDLDSYRKAVNSYIGSTSRLRTLGASLGQKYDDDWENQIRQMRSGLKDLEDYYGQWDSEDAFVQAQKYAAIPQSEDYDQYRGYKSTQLESGWDRYWSKYGLGYADLTYEYINDMGEDMRQRIEEAAMEDHAIGAYTPYAEMTDEEINAYNYLYAKEGKAAADEYLSYLESAVNYRQGTKIAENIQGRPGLQMLFAIQAGANQFQTGMRNLLNTKDDTITPSATQIAAGMVREDLADKGPQILGSSVGQIGYDLINTGANMLPSILVGTMNPAAGAAMMGASASGNAYQEMLNLGYDKGQARLYSALVGASEAGLQYALGGISKLGGKVTGNAVSKLVGQVDNALGRVAIELGGSMLSEGVEEAVQSVLEPVFQAIATGEDFAGVDIEEVLYSGLLGALSAGVMEGPGAAVNAVNTAVSDAKAKDVYGTGSELVGEALEIDPNNAYAQKMQGKLDSGKELSGGQINRLVQQNEEALTAQDTAAIQQATQQRLEQLGESGDVEAISAAIAKQATGLKPTRAERQVVINSKYGLRVANELGAENIKSGGYSSDWAKGIETQRIHPEVYTGEQAAAQRAKTERAETATAEKTAAQTDAQAATVQESRTVEAAPRKVTGIRNGKVTVQAADGKQYEAGQIAYASEDEAQLWQTVGSYQNITPKAANAIIQARSLGKQSIADYLMGAAGVYRSGYYGAAVNAEYAQKLTPGQRELIYDAGKQAAGEDVARREAEIRGKGKKNSDTSKGAVHYDGDRSSLNETQKASLDTMEMLAKALGVQIHVFESGTDAKGNHIGSNGWYDRSDGSIHIDLFAGGDGKGTMLFTLAHELTHFVYQWSPAKFKVLANFLMEQYGQQGATVDELIENQQKIAREDGRQIDEETAFEEAVASSMESMLTDGNVVQRMADLRRRDQTLWQKIKDWFRDIAGKIKAVVEAYRDAKPDSAEGKMVAAMQDVTVILESLYADALAEASENYVGAQKNTAEDGGARYSLRAFEDGVRFVDVQTDPSIFDGMTVAEMNRKAKSILVEKFAGRVIGLDNRVFVNGDSVNEYLHPSKSIDIDTRKTKLTAAGELDNLLDAGTALPNEQDGKDGHIHPDVIDFSYYKTIFKVGSEYFEGIVNVKNIKRGKLLKDVTKIKNITKDIVSSYGNNPKSNFLRDASTDSIRNDGENVNKRFSVRQRDQDYLTAVERGDMDTARKMVDQAAKEAGYTIKAYHGTDADAFTVYDKGKIGNASGVSILGDGFYFADKKSVAAQYGKNVFEVYLKQSNPYSATQDDAYKLKAVDLEKNGHDGVKLPTGKGNIFMVLDPEQIKSADPVTYDNDGNVIPLSERFNAKDNDIRYSTREKRDAEVEAVLRKENQQLKADVEKLKQLMKLQRTVTGGTKFTKTSVVEAARMLKKQNEASGSTEELAAMLNRFYEYIATEKELTWEGVLEQAREAADWLEQNRRHKRSEYAQDILDQIHGNRIYLDESQKAEAAYRFGSYNDFRKSLMGSITVVNEGGISLDSFWHEMAGLYPAVFDEDTVATDMPSALADIIDRLRNSDTSAMEYAYNSELYRQDLLRQVYDSYWGVSTLYTFADTKQAQINRLKGEHYARMNQLRTDTREQLEQLKRQHRQELEQVRQEYREKAEQQRREISQRYQESRKKAAESRHRTEMRHKIQRVVKELNQYLLSGTKDKHVPIGLQKAVAEALDAVNMDTVGAQERIAKLQQELERAKTEDQRKEIRRKIESVSSMGERMDEKLKRMKEAYDEFLDSDDPLIANAHDDAISGHMMTLIVKVGDTPLRDMSMDQLQAVYDVYQIVLTTVRNANKAFKAARNATISELGQNVMREIYDAGGKKQHRAQVMDMVNRFGWNNLKPVYAFSAMGSKTFSEIFDNVRAGEDVWARDVVDAREFYLQKVEKHHYNDWDFEKRYQFTSTSGMDFELGLEQIMSLYAYSKREQAADHLRRGGIVIDETTEVTVKTKLGIPVKFNPTEATAYNISDETLAQMVDKLTKDQRAFVDEMQEYLSDVMGAKGNEVSLQMYGVKLFREKFYFPLKSATQFMAKAKEQQQGEVRIKNAGFSKETVRKANNPIVLTPFMNVWSGHVNEMSMYHAFVLPMEDLYRVYSYRTATSDTAATKSVEMFIQNAYGKGATGYIDQLLKDLNGGALTDNTTGVINKAMGLYKKGAVFASLSVVVQQPSAIARAAALVDLHNFIGPKIGPKDHKTMWAEIKKYAPVAIIKEMGYFDTNLGKSTQDYITGREYTSWDEKLKALVTDSNYRDEALSKLPALADEIAWCGIWQAVKREIRDQNPGMDNRSEEFLQKVGKRFTEVIVKTQVYDSVLARSGLMRSKDTGMKMATAFMAEPTTSINMITDALLQGKRGNRRYCRKAIGAVVASQILNSVLVSFVYAMRDDDEDETYWEKYMQSLGSEVIDSLNPAGYIPFIRDIMSIVQGYDVERSDMSIISDLWKAVQKLDSEKVSAYRKVEDLAGSIAKCFGLPVKNIMRDVRGIWNTIMNAIGEDDEDE